MARQWGVYVIGRNGETKIGMTNNLVQRQMQIQSGNAVPLTLHAFFPVEHKRDAIHVERWAHFLLLPFHGVGEWFMVSDKKALSVVQYVLRRDYELNGVGWINRTGAYCDPNRVIANEANSAKAKKLWEDPTYKKRMAKVCSATAKRAWKDPDYRQKMVERSRATAKRLWEDPEYRKKMSDAMRIKAKEQWQDPEFRERISDAARSRWKAPSYRKKNLAVLQANNERRKKCAP